MNDILTIVLVLKSGGDFNFSDVELLVLHLRRNSKKALRIICLTDIVKTNTEVDRIMLIPFFNDWAIWWSKMNLFHPEMEQFRPFLYMDLDTCVINNIDDLFPPQPIEHFITLENCYHPNRPGSGLMWIPAKNDKINYIWKMWIREPEKYVSRAINKYGDQNFIEDNVTVDSYFTRDNIDTFKPQLNPHHWRREFPKDLSIVYFHGYPRPKVAVESVQWVQEYVNYKEPQTNVQFPIKNAFVINIGERIDRLQAFRMQEIPLQVKRFKAIRLNPGILGCNASHKTLLSQNYELPLAVFEDDCKIVNSWDYVEKAIKELPEDWDILYLGANLNVPLERHSPHLYRLKQAWTTHAIIYGSERVVKYICENMPTDTTPIDVFYSKEVLSKFNCYIVSPLVAIQSAGHSNVTEHSSNYEQLMLDNFTKNTQ